MALRTMWARRCQGQDKALCQLSHSWEEVASDQRALGLAQTRARTAPKSSWDALKPIKSALTEKKTMALLNNPQSELGKQLLRDKFNLPPPTTAPQLRQCGKKKTGDMNCHIYSGKSIQVCTKT